MNGLREFKRSERLMGSAFELIVVEDDAARAQQLLQMGTDEITRIEKLFTEFQPISVTSQINAAGVHESHAVPPEVYQLLKRCMHLSSMTDGAFDITVGPLKKLFNFKQQQFEMPTAAQLSNALQQVGWQKLQLQEENLVCKLAEGMRISFAAVGKGYAADAVRKLWQQAGVKAGVVNASGDLSVWGQRPDGSNWPVSIAHPDSRQASLLWLPLENSCIATSGDGEQYFVRDGKRYSHNIHPKTGQPLSGVRSVSVIGPSAELCDALCTAVYVMGVRDGLHFINQLPGMHAIIFDAQLRAHFSSNLQLHCEAA